MSKKRRRPRPAASADKHIRVVVRGIPLKLSASQVTDYEFLDALGQLDEGVNPLMIGKIMRTITGEKYREVLEKLRGKDGTIQLETVSAFVKEFFEKVGAAAPN